MKNETTQDEQTRKADAGESGSGPAPQGDGDSGAGSAPVSEPGTTGETTETGETPTDAPE